MAVRDDQQIDRGNASLLQDLPDLILERLVVHVLAEHNRVGGGAAARRAAVDENRLAAEDTQNRIAVVEGADIQTVNLEITHVVL